MNHSQWKTRRAKELAGEGEELGPKAKRIDAEADLAMDLAQAVYDLRSERGWSQADLGRRAGMAQSVIGRLEMSLTLPSMRTVLRLAMALDVPPARLLQNRSDRDRGAA